MPKDAYEKDGVDALEKPLKTALAVYSDINASQPEMDKAEKRCRIKVMIKHPLTKSVDGCS